MDPISVLKKAVDQGGAIVNGVKPDQLGKPSTCADWDVRGLLNHLVAAVDMFAVGAQGQPLDFDEFGKDQLGDDPAAAFAAAAKRLHESLDKPGVMDHNWTMPFGEVPAMVGAGFSTIEIFAHSWDVARSTGQDPAFDDEVSETALNVAKMAPAEQIRQPGVFGPEVECGADAPLADRVAAFLGRTA
jgi:uncharacterized protein (TIGR03086 family)